MVHDYEEKLKMMTEEFRKTHEAENEKIKDLEEQKEAFEAAAKCTQASLDFTTGKVRQHGCNVVKLPPIIS